MSEAARLGSGQEPFDAVVTRFQSDRRGSLSERVYSALRRAILVGDLAPGTHIRETEVAARLSVSRTPLREALRRLEAENLIESITNRPVVVRGISDREAMDIYQVLTVLESFAVELAAMHITDVELGELRQTLELLGFFMEQERWDDYTREGMRFHHILYAASKNPELAATIEGLREKTHRHRRFGNRGDEIARRGYRDHQLIFNALAARDGNAAAKVMRDHIGVSVELLRKRVSTCAVDFRREVTGVERTLRNA